MNEFILHKQHFYLSTVESSQDVLVIHLFQFVSNYILFQENAKNECFIYIIDLLLDYSYLQELISFENVFIEFGNTILSLLLKRFFTSLFIRAILLFLFGFFLFLLPVFLRVASSQKPSNPLLFLLSFLIEFQFLFLFLSLLVLGHLLPYSLFSLQRTFHVFRHDFIIDLSFLNPFINDVFFSN